MVAAGEDEKDGATMEKAASSYFFSNCSGVMIVVRNVSSVINLDTSLERVVLAPFTPLCSGQY
jgi:hypothetical protein